ncbi:hypothetical protein LCL97_11375 [Seohaeicola saemankumensis]|nr:hypothetical protein [Seohaeicola saemankumensis]MCA0871429.1 hypothetical protein [Seohaeicola saemankumensis]
MSNEWEKSIKDDFKKAHDGQDGRSKQDNLDDQQQIKTTNGGHDKISDGPRPPVEGRPAPEVMGAPGPGGSSTPSSRHSVQEEWDALDREARGEKASVSQQFNERSRDRNSVEFDASDRERRTVDWPKNRSQPDKNQSLTREFNSKSR